MGKKSFTRVSNVYITGDLHFGHEVIAQERGYKSSVEHDEALISNWNTTVNGIDKVYILGDIALKLEFVKLLGRLNGRLVLIGGNHDPSKWTAEYLKYVESLAGCVKYKGCILSHVPVSDHEWGRFTFNIHAHLHKEVLNSRFYINASLDHTDMKPIKFTDLLLRRSIIIGSCASNGG